MDELHMGINIDTGNEALQGYYVDQLRMHQKNALAPPEMTDFFPIREKMLLSCRGGTLEFGSLSHRDYNCRIQPEGGSG